MQESPKVETFGPALDQVMGVKPLEAVSFQHKFMYDPVQALHMTADQVCKQQEMDHQHQVSNCAECVIGFF